MLTIESYRSMILTCESYHSEFSRWYANFESHPYFKDAFRSSGYRPNLHTESDLVKRVRASGMEDLICDQRKLTRDDFQAEIDEGVIKMTTDYISRAKLMNIVDATNVVLSSLKLKSKFRPWGLTQAFTRLHLNTSAGFPFNGKKGENLRKIKRLSRYFYKTEIDDWMQYPVRRSFRITLRPDDYRDPNSKIRTKIRVIYPISAVITAFEEKFVAPLINYFTTADTFYATGKVGLFYRDKIKNSFSGVDKIIATDIKHYDLTLHKYLYLAAFCAVFEMFDMSNKDRRLYYKLVKYLHCCVIASKEPNGKVRSFVKRRGIISGTTFTNLIDTLANAIAIAMVCPDVFSDKTVLICGDDVLMELPRYLTRDNVFDIYKLFGMAVRPEVSYIFRNWRKVFFLGYWWINGIRRLHRKLAVNKCIFHSRFLLSLSRYDRVVARSASILLNGVDGRELFYKLFPEIKGRIIGGENVSFNQLLTYNSSFEDIETFGTFKPNQSLNRELKSGYLTR